jgi:hypothetical protein
MFDGEIPGECISHYTLQLVLKKANINFSQIKPPKLMLLGPFQPRWPSRLLPTSIVASTALIFRTALESGLGRGVAGEAHPNVA